MAQDKHCEMPNCSGGRLVKLNHESSATVEKYYCSACGRIYPITTLAGNAAQLAPMATFGLLAFSIFSGDIEGAIEHGKTTLANIFS